MYFYQESVCQYPALLTRPLFAVAGTSKQYRPQWRHLTNSLTINKAICYNVSLGQHPIPETVRICLIEAVGTSDIT